jgi:hypothetical protein
LEGKTAHFDLDTGATESVISINHYRALGLPAKLIRPSTTRLKTYSGTEIPLAGMATISVEFRQQKAQLDVFIVAAEGMALFGMKWIKAFGLAAVFQDEPTGSILAVKAADILNQFPGLFDRRESPAVMKVAPLHIP